MIKNNPLFIPRKWFTKKRFLNGSLLYLLIITLGLLQQNVIIAQTSLEWAANIGIDDEVEVEDSYYDPVSNLVYLIGTYDGSDFPATIGSSVSQDRDAFIIALNSDGTGIVWSRLYGGSGHDYGYGIYTDAVGDVFIQGSTESSDLPTNGTTAAFLATKPAEGDGFIARFGSSGTVLKYSTYVPGDHTLVKGMAVSGDNVYLPLRTDENVANIYPATGFVSPNFERGMGVYNINTSVAGSAGLESLAHYGGNFYFTEPRRITIDKNGYIYITLELDDLPYLTEVHDADFFTSDAAQNSADLLDGFNDLSVVDAVLPILAVFSPDLSSLDYATAFYPVKGISLNYETKPAVAVDDAGNIYLYSTPEIYDYTGETLPIVSSQIQQFNNLSGITIPSTDDYEFSVLAKIAPSDRSKYEWVNLFSGYSNNGNNSSDLEVDNKGRIHVLYPEELNGGDTRLVTSNKLFSPDSRNTMYTIFSPTGAVEYSTPIQPNGGEIFTITLDKEECKAYINTTDFDENSTIVTPTYYDEETGLQITVDNADPATPIGNGILVFHSPTPNDNTINDFPVGEDEFCVNSYIYQNPNEGPIIGSEVSYTSGDGSSATHNVTDFYYAGSLTPQQGPTSVYQWQVSRNSGTTWDNIAGENLSVLKPESEAVAGTVQYRRMTLGNCCDTTFSNVITATIASTFNLEVDTPAEPVYYCEGTAEPIPITITGATGNISWQWYNGFTPLTNSDINPASGTGVAQGSFTAEIPTTQTQEGFYRLIITDANGCKKEASISFAKLTAEALAGGYAAPALCPGTTPEIALGPATINPLFDYSWTGPGGFTSTDPNPIATVDGDYFLEVKLKTDVSFCTGGQTSVSIAPTVPHDPALTTIADKGFCQPENPAPIGLAGTAPAGYVYQWSPGLNIDNQIAYSPNFDPGILPFGNTPIDSVTYTFTALRQSDGCIFEATVNVTDTAYAIATVGSDKVACQSTIIGNSTTTGLHYQWEAVSTDYAAGLATLIADPVFAIDGVNANSGSNKFAQVAAPIMVGDDCYTVTYVLRASYIPFPNTCFSTDTVSVLYCCIGEQGCPDPVASQEGTNGYCSNNTSLFFVPDYGLDVEWTTYAVDGVLQTSGTPAQGLFSITADSTKSTAVNATGPHPYDVIVDFDDPVWGWAGANSVTYNVRYYGMQNGELVECSVEVITFSGQNSSPVIGVNDFSVCGFPSPGVELGSSGLSTPYTVSGANYSQAPNSAFIWTWEELEGGTASIDANETTPFPTLSPTGTTDYLVSVQDPITGCIALDTLTVTVVEVTADAGSDISGVCEGVLVQLGSASQDNHSYIWSPTAGLEEPVGVANSASSQPFLVTPSSPSGINYSITVTEGTTGCQATDVLTITTNPDPPTALTDQVDAACAGGVESVYFESTKSGHTYSWSLVSGGGDLSWFRDLTLPRATVDIPAGTAAGTYVFQLTKTKGNCGSTTALYTITVYDAAALDLGVDVTATCSTPYTELSTTAETGVTYRWYPPTNLYLDAAGTSPISTSFNAANHTVYVGPVTGDPIDYIIRASSGAPGYCYSYDTITISPASVLIADAGPDEISYCPGGSALTLGVADAGVAHAWIAVGYNSDPDGTPATPSSGEATTMLAYLGSATSNVTTFSQSPTVAGVYVYELTATSTEGCTPSDQVTIIVKEIPDGLAGNAKNTCAGNSVQIGNSAAPNGYSFTWSALSPASESYTIDNPTATTPNVSPIVTTTYRALITDQATGCQTTQTVTVAVTEKPTIADASSIPLCKPVINQDLTALVSNYGTLLNPIWYANSIPGTVVSDPTMVLPSQSTAFYLVGENAFGCTDTAVISLLIENPKTPEVLPSVALLCSSDNVDLANYYPVLSDPSFTLEWHSDNSTNSATLLTNTVVGAGTYYLFETTANDCASASDNIIITAPSELTVSIAGDVACTNTIDTITANPSGGTGVYTHLWTDLTTGTATGYTLNSVNSQKMDIDASSATPGTINLQYDVLDSNGCSVSMTHLVTITQSDSLFICDNGSNYAVVHASTGLTNIIWYNSANLQVGIGDSLEIDTLTAGMEDGLDSYYYTASDVSGCDAGLCCPIIVTLESCGVYDWGDLPDASSGTAALDYETTDANNGPSHLIIDGLYLGPDVDEETDGQPDGTATGDGVDENGLTLFSSLDVVPGGSLKLPFSATNTTGDTAFVEMWIDWNGDGDFNDPDEFVIDIHDGTTPLPTQLNFNVPNTVIDQQAFGVRLRISNTDNMTPYGQVESGEVEDYLLLMDCKRKVCLPMTATIQRGNRN